MQIGEYVVKATRENELIEFLKLNNFEYNSKLENNPLNRDYVIVVNVIQRYYFKADQYFIITQEVINEDEFYKNINYIPGESTYEKIFTDDGELLYEGYTLCGYPCGLGTLYFDNGNRYQEGVFDIKGLKEGKEYYYNGQLKFEGIWSLTYGYGPNAPRFGNVYCEDGELTFTGMFEIKKGGVGWPMIKHHVGYRNIEENRPEIKYVPGRILKKLRETI